MGAAVRALALRESNYDVEEAARMLNQFSSECDQELKALKKVGQQLEERGGRGGRWMSSDTSSRAYVCAPAGG